MKTLIVSSSLSENSRSFLMCNALQELLQSKEGVQVSLVDARQMDLNPYHRQKTEGMEALDQQVKECDNIIIGMAVYDYSINDSLKILLDGCFSEATGKFFGILAAAGGEKSYLATMHLSQICMNQWRMIQLPRVVYATGKSFAGNKITDSGLHERLGLFADEFYEIGKKLL